MPFRLVPRRPGYRITLLVAACALAGAAAAESPFDNQIAARQGLMKLYSLHLGPLAQMARGNIPYDAEVASLAASNLAALTAVDQGLLWPQGSSSEAVEGTRALPAIWANPDDFAAKKAAAASAAQTASGVAGNGLDAMVPAMRAIGGACGSCHDSYRVPD